MININTYTDVAKDGDNYTITNTLSTDEYCYINLTYHPANENISGEPEITIHKIIVHTNTNLVGLSINDDESTVPSYHWNFYENTLNYLLDAIELNTKT